MDDFCKASLNSYVTSSRILAEFNAHQKVLEHQCTFHKDKKSCKSLETWADNFIIPKWNEVDENWKKVQERC